VGRVLVFNQVLVHEGCPPAEGHVKYIIRSDVMYLRTPPICDTEEDREAFQLYMAAREAEGAGNLDEARDLYRRFMRLSPALADIYGM